MSRSRGQSIVELALILPAVLLVVLVALDFGRAYLGWVVLNNAARVGADYAAIHPGAWGSPGDPARRATYEALVRGARADAGGTLVGCDSAPVPAPVFASGSSLGDAAEVTLTCRFAPITPLIGGIIAPGGDGIAVSARSLFPIRTGVVSGPVIERPPACPALAAFSWLVDGADSLQVDFTDTSSGAPSGWIWDFGNGLGSALTDPSHTYLTAGTYTVRLHVADCSSWPEQVTVADAAPSPAPGESPAPSAGPTPAPAPACVVANFIGTRPNDAQATWQIARFTTDVLFHPNPNANGNWTIQAQSLVGGQQAPCNVPITLGPNTIPGA